jgi:phosphate transport system substrate-binding protein
MTMTTCWNILACCLVAAGAANASGAESLDSPIHGAGATFPAPLYAAWADRYAARKGIAVAYEALGSGRGIERIRDRSADFGASDIPLNSQDLAAASLVQFPAVIGGVVPVIFIPGIHSGQLRMNGAVLADIYLGRIKQWDDSSIAALNAGLALPHANITVVHRSDPSGSSHLWSSYLSQSSARWRTEVGASLTPRWPIGVGGLGNEGVAAFVQRTRFAIGYVEYYFAREHRLSDVSLYNRSGFYVRAGSTSFSSAAAAAGWGNLNSQEQISPDSPGMQSWPITGASFILVSGRPEELGRTQAVLRFFDWAFHGHEALLNDLGYAPLPAPVLDRFDALRTQILGEDRPAQ